MPVLPASRDDRRLLGLTPTVFTLGLVSVLDLSNEMLAPILPVFITTVLGAPATAVGLVEGVADLVASVLRGVSGPLSDRTARKPWTVAGYALSLLARPLVALSGTWGVFLAARVLDRLGKGLRSAPRDALITDATPPGELGRAFGTYRALDAVSAILGPLVTFLALPHLGMRGVLWLAVIPSLIALVVVVAWVREPQTHRTLGAAVPRGPLPPAARWYLLALFAFLLGNASDAFLYLRAEDLGIAVLWLPVTHMVFNAATLLTSPWAGRWADRYDRGRLTLLGFLMFAGVYAGFGVATNAWHVWVLFALYGVFMGVSEGVWKAYLGSLVAAHQRGAAFGAFHLLSGVLVLPANLLAGALWDQAGHGVTFLVGAGLSLVSAVVFIASRRAGGEAA